MIKKNKENKTLFLSASTVKKLGISNLEEQEIYLNNQKLNVHVIDSVAEEYYIHEPYNRANRYLEVGGVTYDNFAVSKTLISSLNNYQIMVHQKTRDYLIDKKFWTQEGLDAFVGEEYFFNNLNAEEIQEKNTLYNLWIQEREFDTNRVSKEIYTLSKKRSFVNELDFLNKKSTIESNLDIIQILIYLKSLLLKSAKEKNIIIEENSFDFSQFKISELEYLPFSFQKSDYEKRRNFINNSKQLLDDSVDYDSFDDEKDKYFDDQETDSETYSNSNIEILDSKSNIENKSHVKIAELKPYVETKLTLEEIESLEKEYYSAGEINVFDDKDEKEHEQIVDIDHVHDEKYNETFILLGTENQKSNEGEINNLKVGRLIERKYRRHHENPMIVDIENKVDFLMAGFEALENDDPEVLERNKESNVDPDDVPLKELKRRSKKEIKQENNKFNDNVDLDSVKPRLDEINDLYDLSEFENNNKESQDELTIQEVLKSEVDVETKPKKEKKKKKGLFAKKQKEEKDQEDVLEDLQIQNSQDVEFNDLSITTQEVKEENNESYKIDNVIDELKLEVKEDDSKQQDAFSKSNSQFSIDDLDPFKTISLEKNNYEIDLNDKIKLDSNDFEAKTQELDNKTLELINELSDEKSKKKKKGWLFSKRNK